MNDKNKSLFSNFNPVSKQEWTEKAKTDLKGEDFNKKLVWKNQSNIDIPPFFTSEDKQDYLKNTGLNSQNLINYRHIESQPEESANKFALKATEEGINGLLFDIKENTVVSKLLAGINLNKIAVAFILRAHEVAFAIDFFDYVKAQKKFDLKNIRGFFDLELIPNYVIKGKMNPGQCNKAAAIAELASEFPNFKAITISGTAYLDSGANQVQEVAYTLNSLVCFIERYADRGISLETIFNNLHFQLAIGSEYFIEIGKFRAFNSLLQEIAKKYGIVEFSHTLTGKTSVWSKSVTDAHTNLLRATTETMSAIIGNVDGVLIDPFDNEFNEKSDFSSRIAGNIYTILKEESYFGKVANPADGCYYIEEISAKIANKALELFKEVEAKGGFNQSIESGFIQQQIAKIRFEKIKLLSQRRLVMVGVNKYPNLTEKISSEILSEGEMNPNPKLLKPRRASLEIEALRKTTETLVKNFYKRPIVELTSFGNLTMRKARAAFAYDFLGVSGFEIQPEKSYENALDAAKKSAKSKSQVVVICSSDQDYDESALTFVKAFRKINKDKVLLLAGNPIHLIGELTEAGLDGCIHVKTDIISAISSIQRKIQKTIKSLEA
ncbi:MAG: methylmalonyl-CoA mutase family protein [Lutibacter sp.]|nr:methylmalonyl-CoA mutase family protein [Lutibacter sp.]